MPSVGVAPSINVTVPAPALSVAQGPVGPAGPVPPLLPFVPDPPVGPIGPVAPVGPTELGPVGPVGPRGPVAPAGGSIVKSNSRCFAQPSSDGVMTTLPDPPDNGVLELIISG